MSTATSHKATLSFTDGTPTVEFPLLKGTVGPDVIDIRKLYGSTGKFTYDPGFLSTASCQSSITYIDGDKGELLYRGYPIEQLATNCDFLEVCYLIMNGELPNVAQRDDFNQRVISHTMVNEQMQFFLRGFRRDAHPMAVMTGLVGAMSAFYQDSLDPQNPRHVEVAIHRLLAKLPTIAAYSYKKSVGQPFMYPQNDLSYCGNFLRMMFATPCEEYQIDPDYVRALDMLFIVHADHEQNCSTSTVRMVGSSNANLLASISAGICALWGPLHGGANEACVQMLEQILADGGNVKKYVDMAKDKKSSFRLMGFGHRVYKNYDPRAKIIKRQCDLLLSKLRIKDPLFQVAQELEEVALNDSYFIEKKLYPNVDFYSGVIYRALGIPVPMFTVLFALGRLPGWIAHWVEMQRSDTKRLCRPRQVYTGPTERPLVPLNERT